MSQRAFPAILIATALVCPAYGADLTLALGGEVEYDDNVFRRTRDEKSDVLFRIRPALRVHEDRGHDVNFSLGYELPAEFAVENNRELQDVDHIVDGDVTYRVNERVRVFLSDRLRFLRSTLRTERVSGEPDIVGGALLGNERDEVTLNDGSIGVSYLFAPRLQGSFVASSTYFDSTRDDRSENFSVGGQLGADYVLRPRHQIGGRLRYTYQEFEEHDFFTGSTSHTVGGAASWRWLVDPTLTLELSAGPSYLSSKQEDAAAFRSEPIVPFEALPAGLTLSAFDKNLNPVTRTVTPGSIFVPSAFVLPGAAPNCIAVDGIQTTAGCVSNIIFDPAIGDEADDVNAIVNNPIAVANSNPRGRRSDRITIFASAVVSKRWTPTLASALRYSRDQGNASGLGGTVIVDAVSGATTWDFAERWQLAVRGDWTNRESAFRQQRTFDQVTPTAASAIPGGSGTGAVQLAARNGVAFNTSEEAEIDTRRWGVGGRITHRLFRTTLVYVQLRYDYQESDLGTRGRSSDFENILATFGVRHTFEPIKLW